MASTRGVALASFAAPPFLTDKTSSPFKKVKQCLGQHRLEGGIYTVNGFLAIHKTSVLEVLEVSLEAYEKHRDDAVEKLNGKVTTVEYLKGKVRRKMEARIDWGDWSLLAMALMMGQHADDVSGMANITPLWPAILHRLMHPWNTQAVRLTGFELMLVMCATKKGFEVIGDVLVHSFKQSVQDDREDCFELDNATEDKEFVERRPEVLEMEYPETSSAQGLAAAKAHVSESVESSSTSSENATSSSNKPTLRTHLSVRLLRAAANNATFGIRSLYIGMAATEGGDHVPHSPFVSVVNATTSTNPTRSNSIHKAKSDDKESDVVADESTHRSVHLLMESLIPNIMSIVDDAKEMRAKKGTGGLLKLGDSIIDLLKDVVGDMMGRPWIQDVVFRADYDQLIDDLFYLSEYGTWTTDHLMRKADRTAYLPLQLEIRWSDYLTRWADCSLNAFKAEANHTDNLSGRKSLQRAAMFVQFVADRILSASDCADITHRDIKFQHDNKVVSVAPLGMSAERMSLSGPRFPSIHSPPPPPAASPSPPVAPITQTATSSMSPSNIHMSFGGGGGVPSHPVSFDSRELTQCWCKLVMKFLHVTDTTFAETKSTQFVLAMKDVLKLVFSFGMRAVERGQWIVFHAVRRSLERWTTERGRCKVNSIGDSVMDCWGSLLVDRSHLLVKILDQGGGFLDHKSANDLSSTSGSLLSSGDEFDFNAGKNITDAHGNIRGLGAPSPPHPSIDILSLIQSVPTFVSSSPVADPALQVALVEATASFVRYWFNCASVQGASDKCRTRVSFSDPQAYKDYRKEREARDRSLVESPSTSVAAATLLQLAASFLLPVLEFDHIISNRPAAIIVAKLLCEGLVLRHDKALHFPDELEDRVVRGLTRLLKVTMEDQAPSATDRTTGRRMLDTIISCLTISSYNSRRCASLAGPTLSLAASWLSEGNIPPVVSERSEDLLRLVMSAQGLVYRVNATPLVPGHQNDRRLIAVYENLLNFVVNTAELAIGPDHSRGANLSHSNISFSAGTSGGSPPPLPPPPAYTASPSPSNSQSAESRSMLLATTATAATLIHLTQLGSVVLKSVMAAENARRSSVASADGVLSDALRRGEIARRSSMQSALENLDEAADMVLQCLDNLSKQSDVNTVLISIRCLQDLAIAYPQLIQAHQVQSVWKTLCDVGSSNLSQLSPRTPAVSSQVRGPARRQTKVHAPPQPPISAVVADSYREMVCAILACLGRWLTIPHARLESNDSSVASVMQFVTSCATLNHPSPKPGFPVRNDICHAARLMMSVVTKYYRLHVFNFLAAFTPPMEGWSLSLVTAGSTSSSTMATMAEQAYAMKKVKEVGIPPWGGVPWGNKSKGATQGRPLVCTGVSAKDPILYHCKSLGWWSGSPNLYQIRSSFGASSWIVAEHGTTANDQLIGPQLYEWSSMMKEKSSRPSDLNKQLTFERQSSSSRRKKTLDFLTSEPIKSKGAVTTNSFGGSGTTVPKRRGSLMILETEDFSEEQSEELDEWSALPGAPQASPVHFDLFDDVLNVFTEEVDTKDDPTFLGNAWGVSLFEQSVTDADLAADAAYEKLMEENRELQRQKHENQTREAEEGEKVEVEAAPVKEKGLKKSAAQSPHVSMLDSMNWILKDDAVMNDFQERLEAEYAAESLIFYKAAREFHALALAEKAQFERGPEESGGWEESVSFQEAKSIYHKFIKNNSDQQINVPSVMVKNVRLALGIESAPEKSKREKLEKEAAEQGTILEPPKPFVLDPEIFAPAIREVTVMLLKDKVPAYIGNDKALRRVKMISEIEKCHRSQATWALDENAVASSSSTRRKLKEYVPDNTEDTHDVASTASVKYFDPYYCAAPPPLPTSMLASLGRFPFPPVPRLASIAPSTAGAKPTTPPAPRKYSKSNSNSVLSAVECGSNELTTAGGGGLHDIRSSYQEVTSDSLQEDLAAIDQTPSKALIKIGVVYAKARQHFQEDMLSNDTASVEFESFVRGLAHPEVIRSDGTGFQGFTGGVTKASLADEVNYVPHFEDEVCEVALHVSTHIKTDGEQQINKTRHICNDTVTLVWSEDERDFLHSTFTSQLTAVTLVIYPHRKSLVDTRLYRVQIITKEPLGMLVTCTGPLTDGAVVTADALPKLVRMTCINAFFGLRKENNEELENSQRRMACIERAAVAAHEPRPKAFASVFAF